VALSEERLRGVFGAASFVLSSQQTSESSMVDVRFGSKADICAATSHVRFTPESGHVRCNYGCPLWPDSEPKIKLPSPEDRRERIQMFQHFFSNSEGPLPTL
jgi:hypothetical protein